MYGFRPPVSVSEVDPAVEGCFVPNALLLFDWGFLFGGWFVSCVAGGRGRVWVVEVVADGCLAPDRDRRLAVVVVAVVVVWAVVSFMVATGPKERGSKGKRKGRERKIDADPEVKRPGWGGCVT